MGTVKCGKVRKQPTRRRCFSLPLASMLMVALLASAPVSAERDELVLTTVDWAPFYAVEAPEQGFITALAQAALDRAGHDTRVDFVPWARAMYDVKKGVRDAVLGAYYSDERAETYVFSDAIYTTEVGLVARADLGIESFDSLRDLTEYRIGYGRGWATSEEFDNADYLNRIPEDDNVLNMRKLEADRIDMIAMNFDRFMVIAAEEDFDVDDFVFLQPPLQASSMHMMFSPELADVDEIVRDFNRELEAMRADGTYDEILSRLGIL